MLSGSYMLFDRRTAPPTTRTFAQIKYETPIFQAGWTICGRRSCARNWLTYKLRPLECCCTFVWKPVCATAV
jgi:hypothetical protein